MCVEYLIVLWKGRGVAEESYEEDWVWKLLV